MGSTRYSEEQKREYVQLFCSGDYTRAVFCREMGISPMSLDKWLDEYADIDQQALRVVEVQRSSNPQLCSLKVHLPRGLVCEIGSSMGRSEIINWIRELKGC